MKTIKKIFMPIFLSIICGFICGRIMFNIYEDKTTSLLNSNIIYLLEDSSYNDYDSMKMEVINSKYIYYEDEGKFIPVVAFTRNKDNIEKIKKVYNKDLLVGKYLINDDSIISKIDEYDKKMSAAENNEEIKNIITEMINLYSGSDTKKVAKIS